MKNRRSLAKHTLGDLFSAVKSVTSNDREVVATVSDLLERGRVQFLSPDRMVRVRVRVRAGDSHRRNPGAES